MAAAASSASRPQGKVAGTIEMPVDNVTTCTFGGPDLKILYITTAIGGARNQRLAGSLFALPVDVPGLAENKFKIG